MKKTKEKRKKKTIMLKIISQGAATNKLRRGKTQDSFGFSFASDRLREGHEFFVDQ